MKVKYEYRYKVRTINGDDLNKTLATEFADMWDIVSIFSSSAYHLTIVARKVCDASAEKEAEQKPGYVSSI